MSPFEIMLVVNVPQGWRQGRAREAIAPSEHASPPSEGQSDFFKIFGNYSTLKTIL